MKKILNCLILLVIVLVGVFVTDNKITLEAKSYAASNKDAASPVCHVTVASSTRIFRNNTGMILCSDENGLKDFDIETSDLVIKGGIFKKVKILDIYEPVIEGNTYRWNFSYKSTFIGRSNIYLNACAVSDTSGNCNWPSQTKTITVALF